jgi:hypothetical protein
MSRKDMTRYNLLALGATVAPVLLVGLGSTLIGTGPSLTLASSPAAIDAPGAAAAAARPIGPKERLALDRVAAVRAGEIGVSPFRPEPLAAAPVVEAAPEPAPAPAPQAIARPDVVVKMIVRTGTGEGAERALIAGKMRAAGDRVSDGWAIESIDAKARSVTFVSDDGQRYTVNLK